MELAMKIMFILNPKSKSGGSNKIKSILKEKFANIDAEFVETAYPGHATALARRAVKENVDTVVAVGGDGTINEVLNGIANTNIALGVIPSGTANDLATYYCLPTKIKKAIDIILEQKTHRADLIQVNNRYYITSGAIGFPSEVAKIAASIKIRSKAGRVLGKILSSKLYLLASLLAIFKSKHQNLLKIRWNGSVFTSDALSLTINNQPFLGKDFVISPDAVDDDGIFDVCLIGNSKTRTGIISILMKVLAGKHTSSPSFKMWRTDSITVEADSPKSFLNDGEFLEKSKKFKIRVIPRALNVIVPETWA